MKFSSKEVLKNLNFRLEEMNKKLQFDSCVWTGSIFNNSITDSNPCLFTQLNSENVGSFLMRSNPKIFCDNDLVRVVVDEKDHAEVPFSVVRSLTYGDFTEELKSIYLQKKDSDFLNVRIEMIEPSVEHLNLLKKSNLEKIVEEACEKTNQYVVKNILKSKIREDVIYRVDCSEHESAIIFDGSSLVCHGNLWDFHPGCSGLSSYKGIKLGNYNGAGSLTSILSAGLKKTVVELEVNAFDYDILTGQLWIDPKNHYRNIKHDEKAKTLKQALSGF